MKDDLIKRWMAAVKPFDMTDTIDKYTEAFCRQQNLSGEMKEKLRKAILSVDPSGVIESVKMFAEEHFSEDALSAAVSLFESPLGKQYLEQRGLISDAWAAIHGKFMGEAAMRAVQAMEPPQTHTPPAFTSEEDEDPVSVGMRMHTLFMTEIAALTPSREAVTRIARMIDCLIAAAQVHAVEKGLDGTPEQYRDAIRERLRDLGL